MEQGSSAVLLHMGNVEGHVAVSLQHAGYRRGREGTMRSDPPPFFCARTLLSRWMLHRDSLAFLLTDRFDGDVD